MAPSVAANPSVAAACRTARRSVMPFRLKDEEAKAPLPKREGNIKTNAVLDAESKADYWLTVFAQDHGIVPLHTRLEVYVSVGNVNDNVPLTVEPVYYGRITENSAANTPVLQITATDTDVDQLQNFTFSITGGNTDNLFSIDSSTGVITSTGNKIDRETQAEHDIEVTVSDNGSPPLSSTTRMVIAVDDVNDNAPLFEQSLYHFVIPETRLHKAASGQNELDSGTSEFESEPAAHVNGTWENPDSVSHTAEPLFRVVAVDRDADKNGEVLYSMKSGRGKSKFGIHPVSGCIFAQKSLIAGQEFEFVVQATDNGVPNKSSTARVSVKVAAVPVKSKHAPTVSQKNQIVKVTESDPVGFLVALIQATDADGDFLWYEIIDGDPRSEFIMGGEASGSVLLAKQLDRETQKHYTLTVAVTDGVHTVHTKVTVIVIDINEHRPEFLQSVYIVNISESTAVGTELLHFSVMDMDEDSKVVYSIHCARSHSTLSLFTVDHHSGSLLVAQPLDRERIAEHMLIVMVRDHGMPSKRNFAQVIIHIQDANDHMPEWSESVVQAHVLETADVGTAVLTVLASDRDHGTNALLTYSIVSGNIGNTFTLDPVLGILCLAKELDSYKQTEYVIIVKVKDGGTPSLSSTLPVHVIVVTPDNSIPRLKEKEISVELYENRPPGTYVTHIKVNSVSSLLFEIIGGNDEAIFLINPSTGIITTNKEFDYERIKMYNVTVLATNMAGAKAECQLLVYILDYNDNSPWFMKTHYRGIIPEDALIGSVVFSDDGIPLIISAKDDDSQINSMLQFSIVESTAQNSFFIDSFTGIVRTGMKLDYEMASSVEFTVVVVDMGKPQRTSDVSAVVHIDITDVNDCPPVFTQDIYNVTVLLPTYDNVIIAQVATMDEDSAEVTRLKYLILEGNLHNNYRINTSSGEISIVDAKRVLHSSSHKLKVSVFDGRYTSEASVLITWSRSSDSGLTFQRLTYYGEVLENSTKITTITLINTVGSRLNEHVVFSILNPTSGFQIGSTTGILSTTGVSFDRESKAHYQLIVQAQSKDFEGSVRIAQVPVNITILDVNDNCPVFLNQPYYDIASVAVRRGEVITKVQATDLDTEENADVRYELIRGYGELFRVSRKTGEISLKQALDTSNKEYQLSIAAYDGGTPSCATETTVNLKIVDNSMPVFEKQFYKIVIPENFAISTPLPSVMKVHSPFGNPLIYSITNGDLYQQFSVNFTTGSLTDGDPCILYTSQELDYEAKQEYALSLRATDSILKTFAEVLVNITITDINDCAPKFVSDFYNISVDENTPIGAFIFQVIANDNDTGINGEIHYSLLGNNKIELFITSEGDGRFYVQREFDYETEKLYTFTAVATDKGIPRKSATVPVWLNVVNINNNPPKFSHISYTCWLSEEAKRGQLITVLGAHDPDFDQLSYNIVSGNQHHTFSIHQYTGVLSVANLHYLQEEQSHTLNVSVSDGIHSSFTRVYIEMIPTNKNSPQFHQHQYAARIYENLPSGTPVTTVTATDKDSGAYGRISYSITSQLLLQTFHINSHTGEIWTKRGLDREKQPTYELPVLATDGAGKYDFTVVHVTVADINDNAPIFQMPEYRTSIYSNFTVNSSFLKVKAEDQDEDDSAKIEYSIYESHTSNVKLLFGINPQNGGLYLVKPALMYENQIFQFFVRASDSGKPSLHTDVPVFIYIMNKEETLPIFHRRSEKYLITENIEPGSAVTKVKVASGIPIDYKLLGGASVFSINAAGEIRTVSNIDRERIATYRLGVLAFTHTTPPLVVCTEIPIQILDVNDNTPLFHSDNYSISLAENTPEGTSVFKVCAEDPDEGSNGEIHYSLGEDETAFTIDPYSGWITTVSPLDRESQTLYTLIIIATDNDSPPLSATSTLRINIIDNNDNPPVFSLDSYVTTVKEDVAVETVIIQVSVTDQDTDMKPNIAFYIIDGDPRSQFAVLPTGHVYIVQPLDREVQEKYAMTIVATDAKFVSKTHLYITVLDVNDEKPRCVQPKYEHTIPESASVGTYICTIVATDADVQPKLKYYITGDGSQYFHIDQNTGELSSGLGLDRETREHYHLTVHVQDEDMPEWECTSKVDITLSDVNDNPPHFHMDKFTVNVHENAPVGMPLIRVPATDNDTGINRRVQYFLLESGEGHFDVVRKTGLIFLAKPLDRETKAEYLLTLRGADQGVPQLWSVVSIKVVVLDINDNPPEFQFHFYNATVPENATVGSEVIHIEATSLDAGQNAQIMYSINAGNDDGKFSIDNSSGMIKVSQLLDYEVRRSYLLTVLATDMGMPPLSNQAMVNIAVLDSNDNMPIFTQQLYAVQVSEDAHVGTTVLQVMAVDIDTGDNSRVHYSISSGDVQEHFFMDADNGQLVIAQPLDREMIQHYELNITAVDNGHPQLSSSANVSIIILDINDNPPLFSQSNFTAIVKENKPAGWPVCQLSITDKDNFPNADPFIYEVLYDDSGGMFRLEPNGVLKTVTKLNSKLHDTYFLHIRVTDNGTPRLHSEAWIVVKVIEESKFPPVTYPLDILVMSYHDRWPSTEIGRVTVTDKDQYDSFEYEIVSPTLIGLFRVDARTGVIETITSVDAGHYIVNVSVSDGKFTSYATITVTIRPIWDDVLKHSISVRLPGITPQEFLAVGVRNLTKLLESVLLRNVSVIGFQKAEHGDLDVLLVFSGAVEITTLNDVLNSGGYGNESIHCECQNDATCRQEISINAEIMITHFINGTSFVSPSYRHQLYCLCSSGYTGDQCEEVLASAECMCPASQVCVPHPAPPGFTCHASQACSGNHTCPPPITSNIYSTMWMEIFGVCISVIAVVLLVGIFVLYRKYQNTPQRRTQSRNKPQFSYSIEEKEQPHEVNKLDVTKIPASFTVSCSNSYSALSLAGVDALQTYTSHSKDSEAQNEALQQHETTNSPPVSIKAAEICEMGAEKTVITYGFPTSSSSQSDIHKSLCTEMPS